MEEGSFLGGGGDYNKTEIGRQKRNEKGKDM